MRTKKTILTQALTAILATGTALSATPVMAETINPLQPQNQTLADVQQTASADQNTSEYIATPTSIATALLRVAVEPVAGGYVSVTQKGDRLTVTPRTSPGWKYQGYYATDAEGNAITTEEFEKGQFDSATVKAEFEDTLFPKMQLISIASPKLKITYRSNKAKRLAVTYTEDPKVYTYEARTSAGKILSHSDFERLNFKDTVTVSLKKAKIPTPGRTSFIYSRNGKKKSAKVRTKNMTIRWKKAKNAKKYEVAYKETNAKTWTSKTIKKTSIKLKLDIGKKYKIRVRGINENKKGQWTPVRAVSVNK